MFTGLIEEVGVVAAVRHAGGQSRLTVHAPRIGPECAVGDSVCINGVCLTVVARAEALLEFEAVAETLGRTNLGELRPSERVNLERAMTAGSRFGGHIVQGHVDAVGRIVRISPEATSHRVEVEAPAGFMRYIIEKGSVAVDGISLTIASFSTASFTVAIIPLTWAQTNLARRQPGDRVNLEADVLARLVERLLEARLDAAALSGGSGGLTEAILHEQGFA